MRYRVQNTNQIEPYQSPQIMLLTENRFEAVRHINSFLKEDTWIGIRNFVDTGAGAGKLKNMSPFWGKALIDDVSSTRYKHMNTVQNPSKKSSDAVFYIEPEHDFTRYSIWAPFQVQYDIQRDALYVLTKLEDVSTIYVLAHRPISALDKNKELRKLSKSKYKR